MSLETIIIESLKEFVKVLPLIILAVIAGRTVEALTPKKTIKKFLGKDHRGIFVGAVLGLFKPGPLYVTLPIVNSLVKKGMSFSALAAFLSSSLVGGAVRFMLDLGYFGLKFSIIRVIVSFFIAIAIGYIFLILELKGVFRKKKIIVPKQEEIEKLKKEKLLVERIREKEIKLLEKTKKKLLKK